ncbi:MAG TPA: addiction module protein [Thermoanaerobaculia bacterium]|jgi:putative addiction module component (TIGR02574 family)
MARKLDEITAEALELARESRAALAKRLLDSLDQPSADEVGQGWVAEAQRRYEELKAGRARTIASDDVFAELQNRNGK